jgi:hypothetical protein
LDFKQIINIVSKQAQSSVLLVWKKYVVRLVCVSDETKPSVAEQSGESTKVTSRCLLFCWPILKDKTDVDHYAVALCSFVCRRLK